MIRRRERRIHRSYLGCRVTGHLTKIGHGHDAVPGPLSFPHKCFVYDILCIRNGGCQIIHLFFQELRPQSLLPTCRRNGGFRLTRPVYPLKFPTHAPSSQDRSGGPSMASVWNRVKQGLPSLWEYSLVSIGAALCGAAMGALMIPNQIVAGGCIGPRRGGIPRFRHIDRTRAADPQPAHPLVGAGDSWGDASCSRARCSASW